MPARVTSGPSLAPVSKEQGQGTAFDDRTIGIIDLGSNSVRLMLVRVRMDGSATVLNQVKHMIRLGAGAFVHHHLREDAMDRALGVLRGLADMCVVYEAHEVIAMATSAVRDAENGQDFLRRVRERTGLPLTVISGQEEARLIYLGVSSGLPRAKSLRLFIDIGGGSTELAVGDSSAFRDLESLKIGSVRLANMFFSSDEGPVSDARYSAVQKYVRTEALHAFRRIEEFNIIEAVGSSGTIQNLAEIAAAFPPSTGQILTYAGLCLAAKELCKRTVEERRKVPGINPARADLIVPGAAILQTIMEEQGFESLVVSTRGLQHGILADYLLRHGLIGGETPRPRRALSGSTGSHAPTREQSVLQLARQNRFEEVHARHVAALALEMFDSSAGLGLHVGDRHLRELLTYTALLHDIGIAISFSAHNRHSYYIIRNSELLGFTNREIEIMASSAFFHRKRPSRDFAEYDLDKDSRKAVRLLSLFLTLAERLDKSHGGFVRHAGFARRGGDGELELRLNLAGNCCAMELDEIAHTRKSMRREWGEDVAIVTVAE